MSTTVPLQTPTTDRKIDLGGDGPYTLSYGTLRYGTGEYVTVVMHLDAAGVEMVGQMVDFVADQHQAWNIEVLNALGVDVTGDFSCFGEAMSA